MKTLSMFLAMALLALTSLPARAATMDDIANLAQKGVGEEVLLATIENSKESFNLSVNDILKLKENKVSEKVILAMIHHKGEVAQAPAAAPRSAPQPREPRDYAMERDRQVGEGTLVIQNLDDRAWSYKYEPDVQTLWIARDRGSKLSARDGISLRMRAGTYKVRYEGREDERSVTVRGGEKSELLLTRVNSSELEALYVTVYENGEKKDSGRLATLRENRSRLDEDSRYSDSTRERVIERERYVEAPSTTVVYRDYYPSYSGYSSYYSYPYYYSCPRYSFGFSYGNYYRPSYGYSGYYGNSHRYGYSGYYGHSHRPSYGYSGHYGHSHRPSSGFSGYYSNYGGRRSGSSFGFGYRR